MATIHYLGQNAQSSTASPSLASVAVLAGDILVAPIFTFFVEPAPLVTACSHDSVSLTEDRVVGPDASGSGGWGHIALRHRVVTDPDTQTLNATLAYAATASLLAALAIRDGNTADPLGDSDAVISTGTGFTITVDTDPGDVVVTGCYLLDGWTDLALVPQSGTTALYQNDAAGTAAISELALGYRIASGATTSVGWDLSNAAYNTKPTLHVAQVYKTAGGGGGGSGLILPDSYNNGGFQLLNGGFRI